MVISRIACDTNGYFTRGVGIHWYRDRYTFSLLLRRVNTISDGRATSFRGFGGNPAERRAPAGVVRLPVVERRLSLQDVRTGISESDFIDYYEDVGGSTGGDEDVGGGTDDEGGGEKAVE